MESLSGHAVSSPTLFSMVSYISFTVTVAAEPQLMPDTFTNLTSVGSSNTTYIFSETGIAWPGEAKKYADVPGYTNVASSIVPPPNWFLRFPNGYNDSNIPNLHEDEHFQNWMRTAGLPTFSKLWGRNDTVKLAAGTYQITAFMSKGFRVFGMLGI